MSKNNKKKKVKYYDDGRTLADMSGLYGKRPSGNGWKIGIANPDKTQSSYIKTLMLSDTSCVTSGNYERFYTVNGKQYHHIIDKETNA